MPNLPQGLLIFGICTTAHIFTWKKKMETQMPDMPLQILSG